jgi:hypothetical protein
MSAACDRHRNTGALPVMEEVNREAHRRKIKIQILPTAEAHSFHLRLFHVEDSIVDPAPVHAVDGVILVFCLDLYS